MLRNMGYEAEILGTPASIKYHKIARYHICNNTPTGTKGHKNELDAYYSFRAKRINLWHGVGVKRGVFCSNEYLQKKKKHPILCGINEKLQYSKIYRTLMKEPGGWGDCYWLTTTKEFTEQFHTWFLGPLDHYMQLDYPRNHECIAFTEEEAAVLDLMKGFNKIVLYLPTYRGRSESGFEFKYLASQISNELKLHNILLIQKSHSDNDEEDDKKQNVVTLRDGFDINTIIPYVSVVITDYSSVGNDAVYHEIPVINYIPDWNEYLTYDRGLIKNPRRGIAGPLVKSTEEVLRFILNTPDLDEHYYSVRNRYWKTDMSYPKIWEGIVEAVNNKKK